MAVQRTVYFSGNVQGVGFRYTTYHISHRFDVKGFVRNLADGRVQVVAEGQPSEIDAFVDAIQDRMRGMIRETESNEAPASGRYNEFDIAH